MPADDADFPIWEFLCDAPDCHARRNIDKMGITRGLAFLIPESESLPKGWNMRGRNYVTVSREG